MLETSQFKDLSTEQLFLYDGKLFRKTSKSAGELLRYSSGQEPETTTVCLFNSNANVEQIPLSALRV